jgi:hypothetical protein
MIIRKVSTMTGIEHEMDLDVTETQLNEWRGGMLIQDALPHLTPDEREFLMTGTTAAEWESFFGSSDKRAV